MIRIRSSAASAECSAQSRNSIRTGTWSEALSRARIGLSIATLFRISAACGDKAAVMEERNRLAREMHDTVAQSLAALVLQMETAQTELAAGSLEAVKGLLETAKIQARTIRWRFTITRSISPRATRFSGCIRRTAASTKR